MRFSNFAHNLLLALKPMSLAWCQDLYLSLEFSLLPLALSDLRSFNGTSDASEHRRLRRQLVIMPLPL